MIPLNGAEVRVSDMLPYTTVDKDGRERVVHAVAVDLRGYDPSLLAELEDGMPDSPRGSRPVLVVSQAAWDEMKKEERP